MAAWQGVHKRLLLSPMMTMKGESIVITDAVGDNSSGGVISGTGTQSDSWAPESTNSSDGNQARREPLHRAPWGSLSWDLKGSS